jgi:hypothetical protein
VAKPMKSRKPNSSLNLVIEPGFDSEDLHIGQTEQEVVSVLGKPESVTRKYKGQYFYNYPIQGFKEWKLTLASMEGGPNLCISSGLE